MKKWLKDLIQRKKEELAKLEKRNAEATEIEEVRAIGAQLLTLRDEINDAEKQLAELEAKEKGDNGDGDGAGDDGQQEEGERGAMPAGEVRSFVPAATFAQGNNNAQEDTKAAEARAKVFVNTGKMSIENPVNEMRAVLVSSGQIATPTKVGGITDMFNTVSSMVDQVKVSDMNGCGEYTVAYEKTAASAEKTKEGEAAHNSDPGYGYSKITPTTVTVLSYISNQVKKLSPLQYEAKVREAALKALRNKVAAFIAKGNPNAEDITEPTGVINAAADLIQTLDIANIDETTLRKISLNYGGDENVVGNAILYLNKKDLVAFGDVRGTEDKKAVYEILPDGQNPNIGIIKEGGLSVRYCINSNIAALSDAGTVTGAKTMFYGQPMNYECALFSNYEIKVSEDFAFDKGQLAIKGEVMIGGNVIHEKGFIVVTKQAAA